MLYSIEYYYEKARKSGIENLGGPVKARICHPINGKTKEWPEVKTHYDYLHKCYSVASEIPFDELQHEYYTATLIGREALNRAHINVIEALNTLNDRDINHKMGYTPISHMREQLLKLSDQISESLLTCEPSHHSFHRKPTPSKRNLFTKLFG